MTSMQGLVDCAPCIEKNSYTPSSIAIPPETYGYLVSVGFGSGIIYSVLYLMIPFNVDSRDRAVGMATGGNQFRVVGSTVSLAAAATVFRNFTDPAFQEPGVASSAQAGFAFDLKDPLLQSQEMLRLALASGYIQ
ncbi:hypothetical protein F5Y18DRAFT_402169 [Xylariaceae sp. FL1019]|nr:hypothetical protein F5Y18DRAFT_402169 [Xylariaceae sp. FL1019]